MADAYSVVADDGTGSKVDESSLTVNSVADVRRQRMVVGDDSTAAALAKVTNAAPATTDYGLVTRPVDVELATMCFDTGESAMGASKSHVVLYNPAASGYVAKVRLVIIKPGSTAVTGALSGAFFLQRRTLTNVPAGTTATIVSFDSADSTGLGGVALLTTITTAPTGTVRLLNSLIPQPDELKLTTLDASTQQSLGDWGGMVLYDHSRLRGAKPAVVRAGECMEIAQNSTAGTGNVRFLLVWTVEAG